ncbi:Os04g0203300 [Oryza sativa Japonica Group]|uniref:Os04g0203300 protein n=1 Tax=Oryza sativa subsp. japonica TaxID=39947 RepID=A0A0P0W7S9_ORYSJ|nr:hypothetical protein EE612_022488 [Oryza sativa]BAS88078.1 Os04g0203300 [Oryza sativa Japonica Group]
MAVVPRPHGKQRECAERHEEEQRRPYHRNVRQLLPAALSPPPPAAMSAHQCTWIAGGGPRHSVIRAAGLGGDLARAARETAVARPITSTNGSRKQAVGYKTMQDQWLSIKKGADSQVPQQ